MKTYQFTFSGRRALVVVFGLFVLNFLMFIVGLIVGIGLWMPTQSELAALKAKNAPVQTASQPASAQPQPVQTASAAATAPVAAPPDSAPAAQPAPAAVQPVATPAPAPQQQTAPAAPAPAASEASGRFALQIGSFTDPKYAKQLETDLKERGYAVRTYKTLDPDQRVWHVVRVGHYPDVSTASRAAAEFTNREQLQALVRRNDAL